MREEIEYVPSLVMTTAQAVALVAAVEDAKRTVMRVGVDYARIPGTPLPSLLKPGAERLAQLFGLTHTMSTPIVETDDEGRPHRVTIRCDVTRHGEIVASCWGSADYDETRYTSPGTDRHGPYRAPWNTLLKMSDKRAFVGAILKATASSGLFTQDLEDEAPPVRTRARSVPATEMATPDQLTAIAAAAAAIGLDDRDARLAYAAAVVNRDLKSSKELTKAEASRLLDALAREKERA
ncbi:MAG: hypothetical protein M0Z46_20015 [Actinomycetota bacterium]|jgi:hypothetical protein|nr:hypothetical protein [Actinomycetota bacterium]